MDMNECELKAMAGERLAKLRAEARARACARARRPLRVVLGLALIRLGTWAASHDHGGIREQLNRAGFPGGSVT